MEILNNIKEKVSVAAIEAVKKSGELMESVKVNFAIADKEAEISKGFREIGKLVYESAKSGEAPESEIASKCSTIDILFDEIALLKARLVDLKQIRVCKSCGFEANETNNFCPRCGAVLQDEEKGE